MLVLGALCAAPLMTMANSLVSNDRAESVVAAHDTWLSRAGPAWAGAMRFAEHEHPMSFAHAARERAPGRSESGMVFSRDAALSHQDAWSANFLSDTSTPNPFASVTTPVPEPGTYALVVVGLAAIGFVMRRRRRS